MNKINLLLTIAVGIALVCGCKFGDQTDGKNNSNQSRRTSDKRGEQTKTTDGKRNSRSKSDDSDNDSDSADDRDNTRKSDAVDMARLAGKWVWSRTGSTTYTDGGSYVGGNGSRFTYEFSEDGQVEFTGIMNVMQGSCSQEVFTSKTGEASLDGDTLTIEWSPAQFKRDFSCDSANNYEKTLPAETETSTVAFKDRSGQEQLCLTNKEETCFSPAD